MRRRMTSVTPEFVEYIPSDGEDLLPGVVYISMPHGTVVHRCPCGCGQLSEFTLDPIRFRIEYDGNSVTFFPSIGNSNLECRSHYWIRENRIEWCPPMDAWTTKRAQRRELSAALKEHSAAKSTMKTRIERWLTEFAKWRKK